MDDEEIIADEELRDQGIDALTEMGLTEDEAEQQFEDMFGY